MLAKSRKEIKVVEVGGSPYEMGLQYGAACPEVTAILDSMYEVFGGGDKVRGLKERYIPLYLPAAEEYAPEIVEEMKGIAAGTNLDFEDIFFLNITYEIAVPTVMGCTSFAVTGSATDSGKTIAGQNFDYLRMWQDNMVLLKINPAQGPGILAMAPAGCLGLIGLNSAGISINLNLLRNRDSLAPDGGVPSHVILRKTLTAKNIGEAIGSIASAGKRSAKNYLLTSGEGDIVDVEATSGDVEILYPEDGIFTHANNFKTDRFKSADLAPTFWPDSYIRSQRLYQLIKARYGQLSIEVIEQLLQDHNNYPNSICRHPDPDNPLPMGRMMKTLVSLISCPAERKLFLALGNPCEAEYQEYRL